MKLKTIIIILLIAAAAFIGYKWYTSKENKNPNDQKDANNFNSEQQVEYDQLKKSIADYFTLHKDKGHTPYLTTLYYNPETLYLDFKENEGEGSEISVNSYKVYLKILSDYNIKIDDYVTQDLFDKE